jgi:hypothetical protein
MPESATLTFKKQCMYYSYSKSIARFSPYNSILLTTPSSVATLTADKIKQKSTILDRQLIALLAFSI